MPTDFYILFFLWGTFFAGAALCHWGARAYGISGRMGRKDATGGFWPLLSGWLMMAMPIGMLALVGLTLASWGIYAKRQRLFSPLSRDLIFFGGIGCLIWVATFPMDHLNFVHFL